MKKIVILFCMAIAGSYAMAQPTLNSSALLNVGSSVTMQEVLNLSLIDTTVQGAGKTWDYGTLQIDPTGTPSTISYVTPSSTPSGTFFPSSNYCYIETSGSESHTAYFILSSTKLQRIGSKGSTSSTVKVYSDLQDEMMFPLSLSTKYHDTWANNASSFGGTLDFECLGYGTLKLPGNKTYSALLVRVVIDELFAIPVYFWYSADNGAVLLQYIAGDGFWVSESARYASSLTIVNTGVARATAAFENISYSNPVNSTFSVSLNGTKKTRADYEIMNALGEVVKTGVYDNESRLRTDIDVSDLKPGIYFFNAQSISGQAVKGIKFLKL